MSRIIGWRLGKPMDVAPMPRDVGGVAVSVAVASSVLGGSGSSRPEGAFMLTAYALVGVAFFFH